ncbi:MAG: PglZ domain-containing protein, partial [Acidobacteriota bacterium]
EMADELSKGLTLRAGQPPPELRLDASLAELPTITPIGMNLLAPVVRKGKLRPKLIKKQKFDGFATGELTVRTLDTRVRAMEHRSLGDRKARVFSLRHVCDQTAENLRRACAGHDLVVIHSRDLDELGEAEAGLATFESLQKQMRDAWQRMAETGLDRFVMTADHGFLLQDDTTMDPQRYGATQRVPQRRYALSPHAESPEGCVQVRLASLGYEGLDEDWRLILRRDTKTFASQGGRALFVHGGNSLQERVIPVLSGRFGEARAGRHRALERFDIMETARPILENGIYRWGLRVKPRAEAQSVLAIARDPHLDLELRAVGPGGVEISVHDVQGGAHHQGRLRLPVDQPVTVYLDLRGESDGRVQLEIYDPAGDERFEPHRFRAFFQVAGRRGRVETAGQGADTASSAAPPAAAATAPPPSGPAEGEMPEWARGLGDADSARAFVHLDRHGAMSEEELVRLLGSARKARRFARRLDGFLDQLPFGVQSQWAGSSKRYVKIG